VNLVIVGAEAASVTKDVFALEIRTLFSMLIRFSLRIRSSVKIERQGRPDEADWRIRSAAESERARWKLIQRDGKRDIHPRERVVKA